MEARLEGMNEFRASMGDMANRMVTRQEFDQLRRSQEDFVNCADHDAVVRDIARIADDVRGLRESRAELIGKASQGSVDRALLMAVAGVLLGVIGIVEKFLK
jgi:hypothetical protein